MKPPVHALRWEQILAALCLAGMALVAFTNVLGRHLFHFSLSFTEELTVHLFVWMTVLGSGLAFERGAHLGMTMLCKRFPPRAQKGLIFFHAVLAALLFIAVDLLLVHTIYQEITIFQARSPAFGLPIWIYQAGVPLLSVAVFQGVWRGGRAQWAALQKGSA